MSEIQNNSANNKRIAKNTLFLYLRMIVTMAVTLYTARIVLDTLGETDYGIYNVIGGIVILFSFLNTAMSNATQRFLSFELGLGEKNNFDRVFSMSINTHACLSFVILFVAETIGLWFMNTQMNIPQDRQDAAFWVYQYSVITFIINILRVPYNASVISYERMSFYAYLSIVETFLNLGIVYLLLISDLDKLTLYACLKAIITGICWLANYVYCKKVLETCRYIWMWDKLLFRKLIGFSGWSLMSGGSVLITQSGLNILINIFNGVTVNAAYGVANQVSAAIYGFVSSFQIAFQPQIVKLHANNQKEEQIILINRAAIVSYFLLLLIGVPFIVNADIVLGLWLVKVPQYAVIFCQLMLIYSMIDAIQAPIWMAINATGNIKIYSLWSSALNILTLPFAWVLLRTGYSPVSVFVLRVVINFVVAIIRILYARSFLNFPSCVYIKRVILRVAPVTAVSFLLTYLCRLYFNPSFVSLVIVSTISLIITGGSIYTIGLSKTERVYVTKIIKTKIHH